MNVKAAIVHLHTITKAVTDGWNRWEATRIKEPMPKSKHQFTFVPSTSLQCPIINMKCFVAVLLFATVAHATPFLEAGAKSNSFWKGTAMDSVVKQLHTECSDHNDAVSCMKYKVLHFLDQVFSKDSFQVSEDIELVRNDAVVTTARSAGQTDILEEVENYITTHDVVAKLPFEYMQGTSLRISPRNLDNDELTVSIKLPAQREGKAVAGEARKSKLKKILIPLMVFVLLKAMTLIPLAIGVLGLKAWNALQLSFFSFVISIGLAIFQLCKKIAADASTAQVATHGPWENYQAAHYQARSEPIGLVPDYEAQQLAYRPS